MKTVLCLAVLLPLAASQLMGGWSDMPLDDPKVTEYMAKVEKVYNQQNNDVSHHRALKATKAQQQVVSGVNYKIEYEFGRTDCKKGTVCAADAPVTNKHTVKSKIYSQPWTNTEEITLQP
ncbi:unnamed protein product [Bursaphelenchus okinawaensis]|uniref:Cystatin domain-containing protein n=1 Tax=Bursaphelenchus okinawaensis TaxID=465554 RepID=A0A811L2S1_9BILA|nr:unnamed protein product [Bursaphelenchus okinawaensis]CAG9115073.1 unnamed protein product [Bursaphelenchus okinawaensis]